MCLNEAICVVSEWYKAAKPALMSSCEQIEEVSMSNDLLRVILYFHDCAGEIIVCEPGFAPYRFFSFEVIAIENETVRHVAFWHDKEKDNADDILRMLDAGINFVTNYKL